MTPLHGITTQNTTRKITAAKTSKLVTAIMLSIYLISAPLEPTEKCCDWVLQGTDVSIT
jgi:hypothetical protein